MHCLVLNLCAYAYIASVCYGLIPMSDLYPFGEAYGDNKLHKNDDEFHGPLPLNVPFPFFSGVYTDIFVNTNGALSFRNGVSQYTPEAFPVGGKMITPFWGDVDTRKWGEVYYRESQEPDILLRASQDIRQTVLDHLHYTARSVYIATWDDVTFYGGSSTTPRNTFQCILTTNGVNSFAIFLYNGVTWTTGTASGGNSVTGLGGTPAQVGFNAGDDVNYYALPASRTPDIVDLETMSNIGIPGKFVFRIDQSDIESVTCDDSGNGSITMYPPSIQLQGGEVIYIQGPCFNETMDIRCVFGPIVVEGNFESILRISCVTPPSGNTGNISIGVSTDGGNTTVGNPITVAVECNDGYWGPPSCTNQCSGCPIGSVCDRQTGQCPSNTCALGFLNPPYCDQVCSHGSFGQNCVNTCHCAGDEICHPESGTCPSGRCANGWTGSNCQIELPNNGTNTTICPGGTFGPSCSSLCHCLNLDSCDPDTGVCNDMQCQSGWMGPDCQVGCPPDKYGENCRFSCHCLDGTCNSVTGACPGSCAAGFEGRPYCRHVCADGVYGSDCNKTCHCRGSDICNKRTGACFNGLCAAGWTGVACQDFSCHGLSYGRYGDPTSCAKFYVCEDVSLFQCRSGMRWWNTGKVCNWASVLPCNEVPSEHQAGIRYDCQDRPRGSYYADPWDCSKYYMCPGNGIVMDCPWTTLWNNTLQTCDHMRNIKCQDIINELNK